MPEPEPTTQPLAAPEPEPLPEPAPAPQTLEAAAEEEAPVAAEPKKRFEDCFEEAESHKQQGAHAAAARLYEESVYLTEELTLIHKAVFAAMSAYLKAGQKDDVRRLALILQESGTMKPAQEMKLSAILKML
jgi:hypothetical protein